MMRFPLERAFDEAAGPIREICPTCLGPDSGQVELPTPVLRNDEPVPTCEVCGEAADKERRSAG